MGEGVTKEEKTWKRDGLVSVLVSILCLVVDFCCAFIVQQKEADDGDDKVPDEIANNLDSVTAESLRVGLSLHLLFPTCSVSRYETNVVVKLDFSHNCVSTVGNQLKITVKNRSSIFYSGNVVHSV